MTDQKNTAALCAKIAKVASECRHMERDGNNAEQRYKYMSADQIMERVGSAAFSAGLVFIPTFAVVTPWDATYTVKSGATWRFSRVEATIRVVDAATGESITINGYGDGTDPADKAVLKAQTAAHRDALKKLLMITSKEDSSADPEADEATDRAHREPPKAAAPKPPAKKHATARAICDWLDAAGSNDELSAIRTGEIAPAWKSFTAEEQAEITAVGKRAVERIASTKETA